MSQRVTVRRGDGPGAPVLTRAAVADRPLRQLLGWCFRPGPSPDEALLLPRCRAVHTAFMRFPIDLLYLQDGRVVAMQPDLPPWRVSFGPPGTDALELPAGTLARLDVRLGERLKYERDEP
jgi:uncharacterized protein